MDALVIGVGVGVIVVAAALIVVYLCKANAKYGQLWAPLAGVIGGSSKGSKLSGTFERMPVEARISATGDESATEYFYELTMTPGPQGKDWGLYYIGDHLLGMGPKSWHLKTKDDALKQRLSGAGVLQAIEQWAGYPAVSYKAKRGTLKYCAKVKNMYAIPGVDEFRAQLALLVRLAEANRQANVG
jgi:hypothetical protein